jgi:hypothetical protein
MSEPTMQQIDSEELAALRKDRESLRAMARLLAEARRERDEALGRQVPAHRSGGPVAPREEPAAARLEYVPLHTWKPTHRHADGGLYRLTGRGKYKAAADEHWSDAVLYDTHDGAVYVTTPARWNDRFVPLTDSLSQGSSKEGK